MVKRSPRSFFVVTAFLVPSVVGQLGGWREGQINTTICLWSGPRVALVRDTVYLDGGNIWWNPGLETGEYGGLTKDANTRGQILTYNLSMPFDQETNITRILLEKGIRKGRGDNGLATGAATTSEDGALLASDYQFYLFGGAPRNAGQVPEAKDIMVFQAYTNPGARGFVYDGTVSDATLPDGMTRYIAYGAGASAPSENKAWYFSGLTSPSNGPFFSDSLNNATRATKISNHLITVDMEKRSSPVWTNSIIQGTKGRSSAEVVWVPVGEQGILVVLGGVTHVSWRDFLDFSDDEEAALKEGPEFMRTIDIYDVKNNKWYKQKTTNPPGARARGCAVVAPSADFSSFNIYYYGGFDGVKSNEPMHDDVWVLSLPSFTWTRLNEGTSAHARSGHKCVMPYPDQMMVFGGYPTIGDQLPGCLAGGPIVMFNMTSGEWMDSYNPTKHEEYGVPEKVRDVIGGDATGGATMTKPADGWATAALGDIFQTKYDRSKITTYYPYPLAPTETPREEIPPAGEDGNGKSGLPSWLAPVLGVVVGLIVLTAAIVLFCLWRRRKFLKKRTSESGTEDAGMRIMSWMRGQQSQPMEVKAPTVTTSEEMPASHEYSQQRSLAASPAAPTVYSGYSRYEMDDTQVMELDDTSPPAELHNTGFTRLGMNRRHSNNATPARSTSLSKPSSVSGDNSDFNDAISQTSGPVSGNLAGETAFIDSPTLAMDSPGPVELNARCTSDISMVTERASHLRNLSDATVSSEGTHAETRIVPERMSQPGVQSIPEGGEAQNDMSKKEPSPVLDFAVPISPPTADEVNADDYLSARPALVSPITKGTYPDEDDALGRK